MLEMDDVRFELIVLMNEDTMFKRGVNTDVT